MAETKKTAVAAEAPPSDEKRTRDGFDAVDAKWRESTDIGKAEIDGWYNPTVALMLKQRCAGQIVGHLAFKNDRGQLRQVVIVKIEKSLTVAVKGEVEGARMLDAVPKKIKVVDLPAGKNVAVGISAELSGLLDYVEHRGECLFWPKELKDIGNGQFVWKFHVRTLGQKGPRPQVTDDTVMSVQSPSRSIADDDDIPF